MISKEDYLRAIYHFKEEDNKKEMKSIELASYLEVSKPSVSEMLIKLKGDGFVEFEKYGTIKLTKKGYEIAKVVTKKHRIIESFLKNVIKLNSDLIHDEAHKLEHAFSDKSINKINVLLKNPKYCPHGKPI